MPAPARPSRPASRAVPAVNAREGTLTSQVRVPRLLNIILCLVLWLMFRPIPRCWLLSLLSRCPRRGGTLEVPRGAGRGAARCRGARSTVAAEGRRRTAPAVAPDVGLPG